MAYTFKDDGSALTFYREYNKEVGTGDRTLVGNWVEERALRDVAETGRYKLWTNPDQDPRAMQKTFTKQEPRPDNCDTFRRVFAHSEYTAPDEMCTTSAYVDPGYPRYEQPQLGARERLMIERAKQLAEEEEAEAEADFPTPLSTTQSDFQAKDLPLSSDMGRRVMVGKPDPLWRKELNVVARSQILEAEHVQQSQTFGKDATFSAPIEHCKMANEKIC